MNWESTIVILSAMTGMLAVIASALYFILKAVIIEDMRKEFVTLAMYENDMEWIKRSYDDIKEIIKDLKDDL